MFTWKVDKTLLKEPFATDVSELCETDPADWYGTYGFRTYEEQDELYKKYLAGGSLATSPGNSAHEFGLALDITLVKDGKDNWDYTTDPDWIRLIDKIKAHPRLHSLANIGDGDHIEAVNWRELK